MEMAIIDSIAHSNDIPMYEFFGGTSQIIETDITVNSTSNQSPVRII